jgi:hypothetical protein
MNEHIGQMMIARMCTKELTVNHMGNVSDGMPIGKIVFSKRESPFYPINCYTLLNHIILSDIILIVKIDKFKTDCLKVDKNNKKQQKKTNAGVCSVHTIPNYDLYSNLLNLKPAINAPILSTLT